MKIYNTLTNKIEEFKTINDGVVNMYVCGPTVYNYAHIGNMYPVVVFDCLHRYLEYKGYKVNFASNFTDVDDKIIGAALELGVSEKEITEKFIKIYLEDTNSLNCLDVDYRPKVTETMDEIIEFISLLLDKGYAYKAGDDVYFRVTKVDNYGSLSNQVLDNLEVGNRIDVDDNKESPYDFVLWKKTGDEGIKWNAPFGAGRPGWHTECVVMINKLFDGKIDIHGGGVDLKFPHHENEYAQSLAAWDHCLANYWMHNGHITVNGEKMSKSLGNFLLARDLIEKYPVNILRIALLKNHYRSPMDINDSIFEEAETIDEKIFNVLKQANLKIQTDNINVGNVKKDIDLEEILDEDLNTPNAFTYLLDLVKELNNAMRSNTEFSHIYDKINIVINIFGLTYELPKLSSEDLATYKSWEDARKNKDFETADKLRDSLVNKNII